MTGYLIKVSLIDGNHRLDYSFIADKDITNMDIFESVYSFLLSVFGLNNVHGSRPIVDATILRPAYAELIPLVDTYRLAAREFPIAIAASNNSWNNNILLEDEHISAKCEIVTVALE